MKTFKEYINEKKLELQEPINLVKHLKDFDYYRGNEILEGYKLEIYTKPNKLGVYTVNSILFSFKSGKSRISIETRGDGIDSDPYVIPFKLTNLRSGVVEFAKEFSKLTGDHEDYEIMMDVLNALI